MNTQITVRYPEIKCYDGSHRMLIAYVTINDKCCQVTEWINEDNHVERSDSCIVDNNQVSALGDVEFDDLFDELDECIKNIEPAGWC